MTTEQCQLCMTYIRGDEFTEVDNNVLKRLDFLQIHLDPNDEERNFLCSQCEENVENMFNFKSYVLMNTKSEVINKEDMSRKNTSEIVTGSTICHFCKNRGDEQCVMSLSKLINDDRMLEVFQGVLPEVDLENLRSSMVCEACQKCLTSFWCLLESWLKARNWSDDNLTDYGGYFQSVEVKEENFDNNEFSDSIINSTCPAPDSDGNKLISNVNNENRELVDSGCSTSYVSIKVETDEMLNCNESRHISTGGIKKENEELQLNAEEVIIKDEDELIEDYVSHRILLEDKHWAIMFRCYYCSYQTEVKDHFKQHLTLHESLKELEEVRRNECSSVEKFKQTLKSEDALFLNSNKHQLYQCKTCSFETTYKGNFKIHCLRHKNVNDIIHRNLDDSQIYTCKECSYETKRKRNLKNHMLKHKSSDDVQIYKCNECSFETKHKNSLNTHLITHKSSDDVQMYKCIECSFETKHKCSLKVHLLKHRNSDEVQMYKCNVCSYETKLKGTLKIHLMKHKSSKEVLMYKCEECPYETKYKQSLKTHLRKHKSSDDLQMYKCNDCSFETKHKCSLKNHLIKHRSSDKVQMYKCNECSYETKYKHSLNIHLINHRSSEEVHIYKCNKCSYETKQKHSLNIHLMKHRSSHEVQIYKCKECCYETKQKGNLKIHEIKHKSFDEVQIYKCNECSYVTKYKHSGTLHLRKHKSSDKVQMINAQNVLMKLA